MQLLIGISINRYFAASGTAGFALIFVNGKSLVPRPPPRIKAIVLERSIAEPIRVSKTFDALRF